MIWSYSVLRRVLLEAPRSFASGAKMKKNRRNGSAVFFIGLEGDGAIGVV